MRASQRLILIKRSRTSPAQLREIDHLLICSDRPLFFLRTEHPLRQALGAHHHDLEEVFEVAAKKPHQLLAQSGPGPACPRLECRDVVLTDSQRVSQLPLGQLAPLSHRAQTGGPNLQIHSAAL